MPPNLDRAKPLQTGVPAALQFAMNVFAFTFFIFMVGRLGKEELAASNIAFSIESIAFMPAYGFSIGLSTLVGRSLGRNDVDGAIRYTKQTICILLSYILLLDHPDPVCTLPVFCFLSPLSPGQVEDHPRH